MDFLTEKDKKINLVLFVVLGVSLLLVPFAVNPGVRMILTIMIIVLMLNTLVIVGKLIYCIRKKDISIKK